jgi:uncharacterized membrane protein (UPF0127 family)
MKKIFVILFIVIAIVVYLFLANRSPFIEYELEGKTYRLMTAKSSSQWSKGLMDYRSKKELDGADGMIFIFLKKDFRQFWNQNTYLNLDVYWIDGEKVVGKDKLPSILQSKDIVVVYSPTEVDRVIEIVR